MSINKIGLHIINGTNLALGRPRVVKLVNVTAEYVRQVRAEVGPECLIVVRWVEDQQPLDDPVMAAHIWFGRHLRMMRELQPDANILWEGYNEIPDEQAEAYCHFEVTRLSSMHYEGLRSVVGNFSVGTPDLPVWETYRPMIEAMGPGDLLGLHEYWTDRADIANPYHCARWQLVPQLKDVPIAITEAGRDYTSDTGRGQSGWKLTCNAEEYLADLHAYGALLDWWSQVKGTMVFQVGSISPEFQGFDAREVWPRVVAAYTTGQEARVSIPIDGRSMSIAEFEELCKGLYLGPVDVVYIHHTASEEADWHGLQTLRNWAVGWEKQGWTGCPHCFVTSSNVLLGNPPWSDGIGVEGHNIHARHIEIVGMEIPVGSARWDNAARVAAAILKRARLDFKALRYHAQDNQTECPGKTIIDNWGQFQADVIATMGNASTPFEQRLGEYMQQFVIPQNPAAAFYQFGVSRGWFPMSGEIDYEGNRAQGFYSPADGKQHVVWCTIGDWSNLKTFERDN